MKKVLSLCVIVMMFLVVGCSGESVRNKPEYRDIKSEVESCVIMDDGRYKVSLLLENGEKFEFDTTENLNEKHDGIHVNMGYDFEEKVTFIAYIEARE